MMNDNNEDNKSNASKDSEPESVKDETAGAEPAQNDTGKREPGEDGNAKVKKSGLSFTKRRSFKYGSMATAFTAIFVAIVILVNVGLTIVTQKYPLSVDLTTTKDYGLSAATLKYIPKINQPITIKVFATESQMEGQTYLVAPAKILQQYPKYNSKISIQYIDYDKNPTAVAAYSSESIAQYDIIVTTTGKDNKEHYKHISGSDLLVTQTDSQTGSESVVGNKTEQQIDNALDYVTSTVLPTVLFTTGHDEADPSNYQTLLKGGNYTVSTVNTTSTAIDENASAIAIVAPQTDFSASEIDKIDKYLKNGGKYGKNIFIFLDPRLPALPNLEEYLTEWGVKVGSGVIYDSTNSFDNSAFDPIASTVDTTVAGSNISTNVGTDVKDARPLTVLFASKDVRTAASVIETGNTSKLLADLSGSPSSSDKSGPFTAMTLSTWSGTSSTKSNMIVSGSYDITDSDLLSASNKNNSKVLLGINNTLMAKQSAITVDSKYTESAQLSLTTLQRNVVMVLFIIIIPLAVLILGLVMWLRRRHL